jgi:hypothetical protein
VRVRLLGAAAKSHTAPVIQPSDNLKFVRRNVRHCESVVLKELQCQLLGKHYVAKADATIGAKTHQAHAGT